MEKRQTNANQNNGHWPLVDQLIALDRAHRIVHIGSLTILRGQVIGKASVNVSGILLYALVLCIISNQKSL